MRAIACALTSTQTTSLMCVKNIEKKKIKEQKTSTPGIQTKENSQFGVNTIISLAYINLPVYPS